MTYVKLTREDGTTRNNMPWAVGITNRATGRGNKLCTDGVLHVYDTPEQAAFMRLAYCDSYTKAWEVRSRCKGVSDGAKRGIKSCTVIREIELPELTIEQRVEIAICTSLLVYSDLRYAAWARRWLSGEDRTAKAALAESRVAFARAAYACGAFTAYYAATAAVSAASYEAHLGHKSYAGRATARAASCSAAYAAEAAGHIDLQSIIEEVLG